MTPAAGGLRPSRVARRMGGDGAADGSVRLTMAASYFAAGMTGEAVFSLFVRRCPPARLPGGGRHRSRASHTSNRCASTPPTSLPGPARLSRRRPCRVRRSALTTVRCVRSRGDRGVRRRAPARGPCPASEAQLVETLLLNQVTFPSAIASKAARCAWRRRKVDLIEFGFRRTHGLDAEGGRPPVGGAGRVQCDEQRGRPPAVRDPAAARWPTATSRRSRAKLSRRFALWAGFPR